jgi:carbamoylphosphate synthase large subunit
MSISTDRKARFEELVNFDPNTTTMTQVSQIVSKVDSILSQEDRKLFREEWSKHAVALSTCDNVTNVEQAAGWADMMAIHFAKRFF